MRRCGWGRSSSPDPLTLSLRKGADEGKSDPVVISWPEGPQRREASSVDHCPRGPTNLGVIASFAATLKKMVHSSISSMIGAEKS